MEAVSEEAISFAARKVVLDLRKFEADQQMPAHWGYLDDNKHVVRCRMSELVERYNGRDPFAVMDRRVAANYVRGFFVSTVFLGLDHGIFGDAPIWFETMVFRHRPGRALDCMRYSTYEQALAGHARTIEDGLHRRGWARWLGYSQSHLRKIQRGSHV